MTGFRGQVIADNLRLTLLVLFILSQGDRRSCNFVRCGAVSFRVRLYRPRWQPSHWLLRDTVVYQHIEKNLVNPDAPE